MHPLGQYSLKMAPAPLGRKREPFRQDAPWGGKARKSDLGGMQAPRVRIGLTKPAVWFYIERMFIVKTKAKP